MKNKSGVFIFGLIIIAILYFFVFKKEKPKEVVETDEPVAEEPAPEPETAQPVEIKTKPVSEKVLENSEKFFVKIDIESFEDRKILGPLVYSKSVQWLKVSGTYPQESLAAINSSLHEIVREGSNACNPQTEGDYEEMGPESDYENTIEYHDRVISSGEVKGTDLLMVKFIMESQCGSTPYNRDKVYWYDLKTGQNLTTTDLFKDPNQLREMMKTKLAGPYSQLTDECKDLLSYPDCRESSIEEYGLVFLVGYNCLPPSIRNTCSFYVRTPFA
ncbi:MAG: hypothetical protein AB7H97_14450 [Pseudobdellovibrionaceae bacterium]